jgi:hypothetical protein
MILFNSSRALVALVNGLNYMTLVPHITFLLWSTFLLVKVHESRGGSRGRQTGHATNVKIANLIKVLNIRPIVQLFFIM